MGFKYYIKSFQSNYGYGDNIDTEVEISVEIMGVWLDVELKGVFANEICKSNNFNLNNNIENLELSNRTSAAILFSYFFNIIKGVRVDIKCNEFIDVMTGSPMTVKSCHINKYKNLDHLFDKRSIINYCRSEALTFFDFFDICYGYVVESGKTKQEDVVKLIYDKGANWNGARSISPGLLNFGVVYDSLENCLFRDKNKTYLNIYSDRDNDLNSLIKNILLNEFEPYDGHIKYKMTMNDKTYEQIKDTIKRTNHINSMSVSRRYKVSTDDAKVSYVVDGCVLIIDNSIGADTIVLRGAVRK